MHNSLLSNNVLIQMIFFISHDSYKRIFLLLSSIIIASCSTQSPIPATKSKHLYSNKFMYNQWIRESAYHYNVDARLIRAIIEVESEFNPRAISPSYAIGLMQIKPSSAGCDVYRYVKKKGCPRRKDLFDPKTNIDIGSAYVSLLQHQHLKGIHNPVTLRYAITLAYVNGIGVLLRLFSSNKNTAIRIINSLSPSEFYTYIQRYHPEEQAQRYILKVEHAYFKK